jgi:hypothetical protein
VSEHLSAFVASQAVHAAPPIPHAVNDRALHVGPEQQPVPQVCVQPEHAPAAQFSPEGQLAHALPPLPQTASVLPGWHMLPAQQPDGQERGSHTHVPLRHCCPLAHAAPEPQTHAPAEEHPSAVAGSHAPHDPPGAAQVMSDRGVHIVPLQQPLGHEVASQTHELSAQCSPALQGALPPQRQTPLAEQLSAALASQATHVDPPAPHVATELCLQAVPSQHPEQDVASHTQRPPMHLWPLEQAAWPPHVQSPCPEQPSAKVGSHAVQACPDAPQVAADGVLHVVPVQHPFGHTQLLHAPSVQLSAGGQAAHA